MFEAEPSPPMLQSNQFEQLRQTLNSVGAIPAIDLLVANLEALGDDHALFYSLLMRKRVELLVNPFPTGRSTDLPTAIHEEYENAIREAGRQVAKRALAKNQYDRAWYYYRILGEHQAMRDAIEIYQDSPEIDAQQVIDIAFHQGVTSRKRL